MIYLYSHNDHTFPPPNPPSYVSKTYPWNLPVSFLLFNASRYAPSVKTNLAEPVLAFCMVSLIHARSSELRTQFAHHRSMLLTRMSLRRMLFPLCSESTNSKKPALYRSRPNSDRHFRMRDMRRLLCGAPAFHNQVGWLVEDVGGLDYGYSRARLKYLSCQFCARRSSPVSFETNSIP